MDTIKQDAEAITEIDRNHLDDECVKLPSDYLRFAFLSAEAKRDVAEAKATLEVVQAEVGKDIRMRPDRYGIEKVTEAALQGIVITTKRYKEAQAAYFRAQHDAEICQAVVWALEHKKRALTLLVDLHGMGYFSDVRPRTPEGRDEAKEMVRRRVRRGSVVE